jgi:hypothetical protein
LVLTLIGFALGGWVGGVVVFVHGMRVLGLIHEPPTRARPSPTPERETEEG